jgi:hypothetical protein
LRQHPDQHRPKRPVFLAVDEEFGERPRPRVPPELSEYFREPITDNRVRLDPSDPATARHFGQCEYVSETDPPPVIKVLLKVKPGLGEGYDWVECGSCAAGWQVPHYAESVG